MTEETWINTTGKPLYMTAGQAPHVVSEGDPKAAFLLVGIGGALPMAVARAYGLVTDEAPDAEAPKGKPAPANKAKQ